MASAYVGSKIGLLATCKAVASKMQSLPKYEFNQILQYLSDAGHVVNCLCAASKLSKLVDDSQEAFLPKLVKPCVLTTTAVLLQVFC